jgi:hypothetical protein
VSYGSGPPLKKTAVFENIWMHRVASDNFTLQQEALGCLVLLL